MNWFCCFRLIYFGGYGCRKHNELSDCFDVHDAFWVRNLSPFPLICAFWLGKKKFLKKILFIILDEHENLIFLLFVASAEMQIWNLFQVLKFQLLHVGSGGCSTYSKFPVLVLECNKLNAVKAGKRQDFNLKEYFKAETPRKMDDLFLWSNIREFIASQVELDK